MQTKSSSTLQTKHQRSKRICLQFSTFYVCVGTHPSTQHLIVVTRTKLHYPKSKPLYLPRLHPWAWQGRSNLFAHFAHMSSLDLVWLGKTRQLIVKKVPYLPEEPWKQWDDAMTQSHELEIWKTNGWNLQMMVSKMDVVFFNAFLVSIYVSFWECICFYFCKSNGPNKSGWLFRMIQVFPILPKGKVWSTWAPWI